MPKEWFADLLSGEHLLFLSLFQRALKLRNGRFSYHFALKDVATLKRNDAEDYVIWLMSRLSTCRDDRIRKSCEDELTRILKENLEY